MNDNPKPAADDAGRAAVNQGDHVPRRVTVAPPTILALLRMAVGSPVLAPLTDEGAGTMRHLPAMMVIDADAWVAWCIAGLRGCERLHLGQAPDDEGTSWLKVFGDEAKRVVMVLAVRRANGNLSHAAAALRTSRRALRERLKEAGLYPWQRSPEPTPEHRLDALAFPRCAAAVWSPAVIGSEGEALPPANGPGDMPEAPKGSAQGEEHQRHEHRGRGGIVTDGETLEPVCPIHWSTMFSYILSIVGRAHEKYRSGFSAGEAIEEALRGNQVLPPIEIAARVVWRMLADPVTDATVARMWVVALAEGQADQEGVLKA